jgi:hypothetical protein
MKPSTCRRHPHHPERRGSDYYLTHVVLMQRWREHILAEEKSN